MTLEQRANDACRLVAQYPQEWAKYYYEKSSGLRDARVHHRRVLASAGVTKADLAAALTVPAALKKLLDKYSLPS
jgi:hypothetical protein